MRWLIVTSSLARPGQALSGVNAASGQNINAAAFNDPNMAANYRGIVPPRSGNSNNMNSAQLPVGPLYYLRVPLMQP